MRKNKKYCKIALWIILGLVMCIIVGPVMINCLFKVESSINFFVAEWSAGEFLGYYGSILSFCSTCILSTLALWQNHTIKTESDKHTELLEKMEIQKSQPFFCADYVKSDTDYSNMIIRIKNISANIAFDMNIMEMIVKKNSTEKRYVLNKKFDCVPPNEKIEVDLPTPYLERMNGVMIAFNCKDIYGRINEYIIQAFINSLDTSIEFIIRKEEK